MKHLRALLTALLLVAMVGCSSTRDVTTDRTPAPSSTESTSETQPEAPAASNGDDTEQQAPSTPATIPGDWYLQDEADSDLRGVSATRAYETLLTDRQPKQTVVVAIIDSGIDIEHEDLSGVIWTNDDEVPGNEVDDDGNGYVDDVHGWNFIGGPDGTPVDHDTYELTRLYARLSSRFADVDPDTLAAEQREEYARYEEIRNAFEQKRREYERMAFNLTSTVEAIRGAKQIVSRELGVNALSLDTLQITTLQELSLDSQGGQQARNILMYLVANGVTENALDDEIERVRSTLEYGYNPDFDPRSIVGDDYDDPDERYYGNPLVEGPDASHGTHVAGIVGADRTNGIGIEGIANSVEIMVVRAVPDGDERDKDVANAIRYAVDNGADIINMSFGKAYSPEKHIVDAAVRYADEQGVLMIHAAGNSAANIDSTANFPTKFYADGGTAQNWIEVGAISHGGSDAFVASFSNYGKRSVDVFAPGVDLYSTIPDSKYRKNSGTSMAAPVVTGVAALVMAYYPQLTAAQVKDVLLTSAVAHKLQVNQPGTGTTVDFGSLSTTGAVINAYEALGAAAALSEQP